MLGSFSNLKHKLIYPTDDTDPADGKPANDEASEKEEKQNAESIFEELQPSFYQPQQISDEERLLLHSHRVDSPHFNVDSPTSMWIAPTYVQDFGGQLRYQQK